MTELAALAILWIMLCAWHWLQHRRLNRYLDQSPLADACQSLLRSHSAQALLASFLVILAIFLYGQENALLRQRLARSQAAPPPIAVARAPAAEPAPAITPLTDDARQEKLDELKQRYETLYISFFLMQKCGTAQEADLHVIGSALLEELAALGAEASMQQDVFTAAQGSYDEVYRHSSCDGPTLADDAKAYRHYLDVLTDRQSAP